MSATSLFEAACLCLEKRLGVHTTSEENLAKLKLALEQMQTTIERTEQIQKTLDHLEHLPKHIQRHEIDLQDMKTPFDQIATRFYPSIDCGQQARELFREQMSKQAPNSFVTCCNTIVTMSADETNSDFMNDDTTIIRCQIPKSMPLTSVTETTPVTTTDEGMLKGLECLLLSEPVSTPMMMPNEEDSFLAMEQECKMESESFMERPQRKTTMETNVAAVIMDDRMDEDSCEKENRTPNQPAIPDFQFNKLESDIHFISPIISVPSEQ